MRPSKGQAWHATYSSGRLTLFLSSALASADARHDKSVESSSSSSSETDPHAHFIIRCKNTGLFLRSSILDLARREMVWPRTHARTHARAHTQGENAKVLLPLLSVSSTFLFFLNASHWPKERDAISHNFFN